jgi:RsiW-degrading membrane proteinase PrsW (M82 family)
MDMIGVLSVHVMCVLHVVGVPSVIVVLSVRFLCAACDNPPQVNTLLQMMLLGLTLASPAFGFEHHPSLQVLWYITGATTLISGWSYLFSRNGFQLLKSKSTQK